jgi:polyisoprenoid-binding protein YceI
MLPKIKWLIDPLHSEIGFKVKHMMFTNVSGRIGKYDSIIETSGDDFSTAVIEFTGDVDSITTGAADRDAHILSPDFFDAARFPKISFVALAFEKVNEGNFEIKGDLTMHGQTLSIKLSADYGGLIKDPWGQIKAAFTITGKINRKDWGLEWNAALETGGVLVSEEVQIMAELQLIRQ